MGHIRGRCRSAEKIRFWRPDPGTPAFAWPRPRRCRDLRSVVAVVMELQDQGFLPGQVIAVEVGGVAGGEGSRSHRSPWRLCSRAPS